MPEPLSEASARVRVLGCHASPRFDAMLDYCLGATTPRTDPQITSMSITSDGFLMVWRTDRLFKETLEGTASDFDRNLKGICAHVGLNDVETKEVVALAYTKISDWRTERVGRDPHLTCTNEETL